MKKYMGKYTKKQIGIIIGMWIGDGYISKFKPKRANAQFIILNSIKQKAFVEHKRNRLREFGFKVSKIRDIDRQHPAVSFSVNNSELFNQLRLVLYPKNNRTIKRKWLNYLNEEGLALWIMDDGAYTNQTSGNGYITLHTNCYNYHEHKIMIKYFKQVWDLHPTLRVVNRKNRPQTYFLKFNTVQTKELIKIIKPHIIPSMMYKVGVGRKE